MSTEYGVNISNKFAFLDDADVDPAELIARAAKEKKEKQKLAKATKAAPVAAPVKPTTVVKENNENRRPGNGPRGSRGPRRECADLSDRFGEKRPPRENRGFRRDGALRDGPPRDGPPRPRRSGEFKSRFDGEHNGEEVDGERPRRFQRRDREDRPSRVSRTDRVSGSDKTGVRSVPKKDGHGRGNWGDDKDELAGETEQLIITENKENGADVNESVEKVVEQEPEEAKEPPQLTLAEWKAQQKQEKQQFKTRKANEGADQKALQKFVPLKKDLESENEEEEEEEIVLSKRQQSQKTVDIRVNFNDSNRRDRDSRGPRNFTDRRGPASRPPGPPPARGPHRDGRAPQIDLAHDFPALGAH